MGKRNMEEFIIELELLSPVHVGSGKELDFSDFIQIEDRILIIDYPKLMKADSKSREIVVNTHPSEIYQKLSSYLVSKKDILPKMGVVVEEIKLSSRVRNYFSKSKDSLKNVKLLPRYLKGEKYFPGSSLKGAFRSAILAQLIMDDEKDYFTVETRKGNPKDPVQIATDKKKFLEAQILKSGKDRFSSVFASDLKKVDFFDGNDKNKGNIRKRNISFIKRGRKKNLRLFELSRDPFQHFHLTDSFNSYQNSILFYQKRLNLAKNEEVSMNTFLETFEAGFKFKFKMKIDFSKWKNFGIKTIDDVMESCNIFYGELLSEQIDYLKGEKVDLAYISYLENIKAELESDECFPLRLGNGIGRYYMGLSALFFPPPKTMAILDDSSHKFLGWVKAKIN